MGLNPSTIIKTVQIASVLEVSGHIKPGNVHRTRDHEDMVFEDFLISAVIIGDIFGEAIDSINKDKLEEANLGKYIFKAVEETYNWVETNTNLGIMMMCIPIACSAAISDSFEDIQENVKRLMEATTVDDACYLYDAINLADAGGMGDQDDFDVNDDLAKDELRANNQTMYDVLKISADWDRLGNELTSGMPVVFGLGCPTYLEASKNLSKNDACVKLFLELLSNVPDTLISRKYGDEISKKLSAKSKELLKETNNFKAKLKEFDDYLFENGYNPGTTADLTAASIMLAYLKKQF